MELQNSELRRAWKRLLGGSLGTPLGRIVSKNCAAVPFARAEGAAMARAQELESPRRHPTELSPEPSIQVRAASTRWSGMWLCHALHRRSLGLRVGPPSYQEDMRARPTVCPWLVAPTR